jgi:hypothetical protein
MKTWIAILSILGGISGIISGILTSAGGTFINDAAVTDNGVIVFWLSIFSIFLGFLSWVKFFKLQSALFLIGFSIYGIIVNGLLFTFAFIFLLIAGVLALVRKDKEKDNEIIA